MFRWIVSDTLYATEPSRLGTVNEELSSMLTFDYAVVVNHQDELDATVDRIKTIVATEKCRVTP